MANPPNNVTQGYYWNTNEVPQNMEYYPAPPVPNFPPPNYNEPPSYTPSCSYNVPPPTVQDIKPIIPIHHFPSSTYQGEVGDLHASSYQNQMMPEGNQCYVQTDFAQPTNATYNAPWSESREDYHYDTGNKWQANNTSVDWTTYHQAPSNSWYDVNKTYDNEKIYSMENYEPSQKTEETEWKYNNRKNVQYNDTDDTISKQKSRSPSSRSGKSYKSRYDDDHQDRCRRYVESLYDNDNHDKRSSYKRYGVNLSRSEESYLRIRSKKRSRSQDSHSIRDATPSSSVKRKGPSERELLLEKYRYHLCIYLYLLVFLYET